MKKSFIITLTALAALVMSCQKGNVNDVPASDLAEVTFAIELPVAPATKTIGDGTTATELYYAAFNQNGEYIESLAQADVIAISGKTATVNVKLVRNYTYSFVFWAQAPDAPYEFDAETGVVTVDYEGDANDETRDAFCKLHTFKVPDAATFAENVTLTRPFAQINFGTSDFEQITELGLDMESTVVIAGLADTYNILSGAISGTATTELDLAAVPAQLDPAEVLAVGGKNYGYVSMNYVLAPVEENQKIAKVTATFAYNGDEVEVAVDNVPFRRNYRTNIVGSFFTDNVTFTIVVDPAFDERDFEK